MSPGGADTQHAGVCCSAADCADFADEHRARPLGAALHLRLRRAHAGDAPARRTGGTRGLVEQRRGAGGRAASGGVRAEVHDQSSSWLLQGRSGCRQGALCCEPQLRVAIPGIYTGGFCGFERPEIRSDGRPEYALSALGYERTCGPQATIRYLEFGCLAKIGADGHSFRPKPISERNSKQRWLWTSALSGATPRPPARSSPGAQLGASTRRDHFYIACLRARRGTKFKSC